MRIQLHHSANPLIAQMARQLPLAETVKDRSMTVVLLEGTWVRWVKIYLSEEKLQNDGILCLFSLAFMN